MRGGGGAVAEPIAVAAEARVRPAACPTPTVRAARTDRMFAPCSTPQSPPHRPLFGAAQVEAAGLRRLARRLAPVPVVPTRLSPSGADASVSYMGIANSSHSRWPPNSPHMRAFQSRTVLAVVHLAHHESAYQMRGVPRVYLIRSAQSLAPPTCGHGRHVLAAAGRVAPRSCPDTILVGGWRTARLAQFHRS